MKKLIALLSALDRASLAWEAKLENKLFTFFNRPLGIVIGSILVALLFICLLTVPHLFKN
jgi:hypothetical protein